MQDYLIPAEFGETEYVEKHSRFIGRVWHTETEEEALKCINSMREQHWDATHNVYAYSIKNGGVMRYSDDGEPSGTSGMPVLNVFRSSGIQDFCCVVTRYFGGILLGAGGLVRAYTKTAAMALEKAGIAKMQTLANVSVSCSYPQFERIKTELLRMDAVLDDTQFTSDVVILASVPVENCDTLRTRINELTAGSAEVVQLGSTLKPVPIKK